MTVETKIACIGAGYWGRNLVRNFDALHALSWICEADTAKHAELAAAYPRAPRDRLGGSGSSDPGVERCRDRHSSGDARRAGPRALAAGKDVFVEKPLCLSVEEGEDLAKLAASNGRVLMVGHLLWYHPAVLRLKRLIDEGELGRIQYIYSNRLNLGKIRSEENILWSFAPHDVSVILGLVGEMPEEIHAQGGNYLNDRIADVTVSLLSFASGVKAHIFVSWLHPFKEQKLVVVGDRKMAVFNDMEKENKLLLYPHVIRWEKNLPVPTKAEAEPIAFEPGEPLQAECLHFLECIRTRATPRTDAREGLRVLKVLQGCQAALERGPTPPQTVAEAKAPKAPISRTNPPSSTRESRSVKARSIWHVSHILKNSRVGKDCRIGQNVVIGPNAIVGNGVKIQNNVSVYEGVTLEDGVFCGPSMVFTNVFNPRERDPEDARAALHAGAPRRELRGKLHDRVRHNGRDVCVHRRGGRRRQGCPGLRTRGRKPGTGHRMDVRLRKPNSIRRQTRARARAWIAAGHTRKQKETVTLDA